MNQKNVNANSPKVLISTKVAIRAITSLFTLSVALLAGLPSIAMAQRDVTLTYCVDPDWLPYEAIRNGQHIGISADYLRLIGELAGIEFTLLATTSWSDTLEGLQDGRCEATAMINRSPTREQYLDFSDPYFAAPNVLLGNDDSPIVQGYAGVGNRLLGAVQGYRHAEYIARYYPELRVQYLNSESEAILALASGDVDMIVGSLLSVNQLMIRHKLNDLKIVGYAQPMDSVSIGLTKANAHLMPRINEAIAQIPEAKSVAIYKRWSRNIVTTQQRHFPYYILIALFVISAVIIGWRRRIQRQFSHQMVAKNQELESLQSALLEKNRTLEFLTSHDSQTGLYNRKFMLQKVEEEVGRFQRFNTQASIMLVSVRDLESLEARLTPQAIDETFRTLASICIECVREVDLAGRWNTHEFLVLCPQTPVTAAKILAERLIGEVSSHPDEVMQAIRVGIGIAALEEHESLTEWYHRAEQAVAKSQGRTDHAIIIAD